MQACHILFHERTNFGNQKIIREIKRTNFGNQKIIQEIKRTRQESKHIIILVILLEHRTEDVKCGKNISDTLGCASCAIFLFLPHFDVICDLLLNRSTATWNLFVKYITRSASKHFYYLPKVRANYSYGKFNIGFLATVIWNAINEQVKTGSLSKFKLSLKGRYLSLYCRAKNDEENRSRSRHNVE